VGFEKGAVLAKGLSASPGCAQGKARVLLRRSSIDEFEDGEILIAENTPPEWIPLMRRAIAIVTDSGGITCHASIVCRELGIPCIVGTGGSGIPATQSVLTGMEIKVDATHGFVYAD
jgi:pyruvate,water dikinase